MRDFIITSAVQHCADLGTLSVARGGPETGSWRTIRTWHYSVASRRPSSIAPALGSMKSSEPVNNVPIYRRSSSSKIRIAAASPSPFVALRAGLPIEGIAPVDQVAGRLIRPDDASQVLPRYAPAMQERTKSADNIGNPSMGPNYAVSEEAPSLFGGLRASTFSNLCIPGFQNHRSPAAQSPTGYADRERDDSEVVVVSKERLLSSEPITITDLDTRRRIDSAEAQRMLRGSTPNPRNNVSLPVSLAHSHEMPRPAEQTSKEIIVRDLDEDRELSYSEAQEIQLTRLESRDQPLQSSASASLIDSISSRILNSRYLGNAEDTPVNEERRPISRQIPSFQMPHIPNLQLASLQKWRAGSILSSGASRRTSMSSALDTIRSGGVIDGLAPTEHSAGLLYQPHGDRTRLESFPIVDLDAQQRHSLSVDGTTHGSRPSSAWSQLHSSSPARREKKKWLIIVTPPRAIAASVREETNMDAHSFRTSEIQGQGILLPLHPSMSMQILLILREFRLPSYSALRLYLCLPDSEGDCGTSDLTSHSTETSSITAAELRDVKVLRVALVDDTWFALWANYFDEVSDSAQCMTGVYGLPIAGRLEFEVCEPKKAAHRYGLQKSNQGALSSDPSLLDEQLLSSQASHLDKGVSPVFSNEQWTASYDGFLRPSTYASRHSNPGPQAAVLQRSSSNPAVRNTAFSSRLGALQSSVLRRTTTELALTNAPAIPRDDDTSAFEWMSAPLSPLEAQMPFSSREAHTASPIGSGHTATTSHVAGAPVSSPLRAVYMILGPTFDSTRYPYNLGRIYLPVYPHINVYPKIVPVMSPSSPSDAQVNDGHSRSASLRTRSYVSRAFGLAAFREYVASHSKESVDEAIQQQSRLEEVRLEDIGIPLDLRVTPQTGIPLRSLQQSLSEPSDETLDNRRGSDADSHQRLSSTGTDTMSETSTPPKDFSHGAGRLRQCVAVQNGLHIDLHDRSAMSSDDHQHISSPIRLKPSERSSSLPKAAVVQEAQLIDFDSDPDGTYSRASIPPSNENATATILATERSSSLSVPNDLLLQSLRDAEKKAPRPLPPIPGVSTIALDVMTVSPTAPPAADNSLLEPAAICVSTDASHAYPYEREGAENRVDLEENAREPSPIVFSFPPANESEDMPFALAHFIIEAQNQSITRRGRFCVALGNDGVIPKIVSEGLINDGRVEWDKWEVFFPDEKLVPLDDAESTYATYNQLLFSKVPLPAGQIHPIQSLPELADETIPIPIAEDISADYEAKLLATFPDAKEPGTGLGPPQFDLVLLGMGEDGHCAKLFPGHPLLDEKDWWVCYLNESPNPRISNITMTLPVLCAARRLAIVCTGSAKREALANALDSSRNADDPSKVPAGRIRLSGHAHPVVFFVDEHAKRGLDYPESDFWA